MKQKKIAIKISNMSMKCIVLEPKEKKELLPGILWIHGGGYVLGMAGMVHMSCGKLLAKKYGAIVLSPEYRLADKAPYPAALDDCYGALEYMWDHAEELGIDRNHIVVGGESAGGGLAVAVCLYARDKGKIQVDMQIPLYPMLDCEDTSSSKDNHGRVWNTRRNHWGWKKYLGPLYQTKNVPSYASPARENDFRNLPKCYTYVSDGEPFYQETLDYIAQLKKNGVQAAVKVYHGNIHAFDMLCPWMKISRDAKRTLCRIYEQWMFNPIRGGKKCQKRSQ